MTDPSESTQLLSALEALLPTGCGASASAVATEAEAFEYAEEGAHLGDAVVGRRNEFICGRRCAREALSHVGLSTGALVPDHDGVPQWPSGAIASISHSRGLCGAVASPARLLACLGLDLEKTNRLSPRAMARVLHPQEVDAVGADQALGSLFFSAKEAFFKAQFPKWGAQPNFHDLALRVDSAAKRLSVELVADYLPETLRRAAVAMQFRYQFFDDYVVTLCWLLEGEDASLDQEFGKNR